MFSNIIQHIPDRNFKMIRYYGSMEHGRRIKKLYSEYLQRSLNQTTFDDFSKIRNIWALKCPDCKEKMTFATYKKGPPKEKANFGSKLPDWMHPMFSHSHN